MAARARRLTRRGLLGGGLVGAAAALAGCGGRTSGAGDPSGTSGGPDASSSPPARARRTPYGDDPSQFVDLRRPADGTEVLGTVVLLHGGYWLPSYGLDQLDPMADRLTGEGWVTANVEYRRTGQGGGVPATLEDVAAAVDALADQDVPLDRVVAVGHSAGGHLAVWLASRTASTPGGAPAVPLSGAISLSGVLDLTTAATAAGSSAPVTAFVGGTPQQRPEAYRQSDPTLLVPAACPVWAVHAEDDQVVPLSQSTAYVAADRAAGGRARRVLVPGDHFSIIDVGADSFSTVERLLGAAPRLR
ncbi:Acetyl esterase/lipase [Nocardioides scoriae]|uniref:Acetyl esterase/lipase n=1 Tax=Nocardioides scoriae TaxID=642780 RepID=A0A1H1VWQ0_9ACTN|nr:alpha/beta fold hydrolase [Nocardioides scoriae]SDS88479.1 Acetyl esterase/lipase [Nocardioides scoriae]